MLLSEVVSRTHGEEDVFDVPCRSKVYREKSAEVIVLKVLVAYREELDCAVQ